MAGEYVDMEYGPGAPKPGSSEQSYDWNKGDPNEPPEFDNQGGVHNDLSNWGQMGRDRQGQLESNRQGEKQAIGDWESRFKDDYKYQMRSGAMASGHNQQADAQMGGMSGALSRGAGQSAGNTMAVTNQQAAMVGNQMDMASAMARYEQSQSAAQHRLAGEELQQIVDPTVQGQITGANIAETNKAAQDFIGDQQSMQNYMRLFGGFGRGVGSGFGTGG